MGSQTLHLPAEWAGQASEYQREGSGELLNCSVDHSCISAISVDESKSAMVASSFWTMTLTHQVQLLLATVSA